MFVQGKAHLLGTRDILYNEANSLTEKLSWSALKMALAQGITAGLFGNLPPTIYVCGTLDNVNEELCARYTDNLKIAVRTWHITTIFL